jgi:hypothetical protein
MAKRRCEMNFECPGISRRLRREEVPPFTSFLPDDAPTYQAGPLLSA